MKCLYSRWFIHSTFLVFLLFQFTIPLKSLAVSSNLLAGFAPQSVWISQGNPTAGDSVKIFTVLYNSSKANVSGELVFIVDDMVIGSKKFTINAGESKVESFPWIALVGKHTFSARIEKLLNPDTGAEVVLLNQTTNSSAVEVLPSPPLSKNMQNLNAAVSTIKTVAASTTPIIAGVIKSIYSNTENIREKIKSNIEKKTEKKLDKITTSTNILPVQMNQKNDLILNSNQSDDGSFIFKKQSQLSSVIFTIVNSKKMFYFTISVLVFLLMLILKYFIKKSFN